MGWFAQLIGVVCSTDRSGLHDRAVGQECITVKASRKLSVSRHYENNFANTYNSIVIILRSFKVSSDGGVA